MRATKAAVLVDASNYYSHLENALSQATQSILIVGWDFDGRIKLCPDHQDCRPLGDFLRSLVETRPRLEIRILVWSGAVVHAPGAPMPLLVGAAWQEHPRITLKLDHHHPLYASHHQKMVVIDDAIAFIGGIDLTVERWDTCGHSEANPHRFAPDGAPYSPIHDVQMVVDGEAAAAIGEVARQRWNVATGEDLRRSNNRADLWPSDIAHDFSHVPVAIARTVPAWGKTSAVKEVAVLTEDLLSAAHHAIYIEAQYFTASNIRRFIEKSLAAKYGPEIVLVVKRASPGRLERYVMGANRDRMIRHIRQADRHNRFRIYYPVVKGRDASCEVLIHAKIMIIDSEFIRVGSSNLNNRSMGLDTECDLVVEAVDEAQRRKIVDIRNGLLAEHLGVAPDAVSTAIANTGSLIRAIEACNSNARGLRPFPETDLDGPTEPISGTGLMDPAEPLSSL